MPQWDMCILQLCSLIFSVSVDRDGNLLQKETYFCEASHTTDTIHSVRSYFSLIVLNVVNKTSRM
jgi:hypothetical protein